MSKVDTAFLRMDSDTNLMQTPKLGNHFGLASLMLPLGIDNPVERVYEVRRRMAALKGSYQPLLAVAGLLVKPAQDLMLNIFSKKPRWP